MFRGLIENCIDMLSVLQGYNVEVEPRVAESGMTKEREIVVAC